jgi:hypothetical protein
VLLVCTNFAECWLLTHFEITQGKLCAAQHHIRCQYTTSLLDLRGLLQRIWMPKKGRRWKRPKLFMCVHSPLGSMILILKLGFFFLFTAIKTASTATSVRKAQSGSWMGWVLFSSNVPPIFLLTSPPSKDRTLTKSRTYIFVIRT